MKNLLVIVSLVLSVSTSWAKVHVVTLKNSAIPVTTFNITFRAGSADDKQGEEGSVALLAGLIREGGVREMTIDGKKLPARTRAEIEELLFPLAAEIDAQVAREQTSFRVTVASQDASVVFDLLTQMLLAPAFDEKEFERIRGETLEHLSKRAPREDQEELGKAALERAMYGAAHPYGHVVHGTIKGVNATTLERVKALYKDLYTQKRLTFGVAGVVSNELLSNVRKRFAGLPAGKSAKANIAPGVPSQKMRLTIVTGPFDATGVHLGHPVSFHRGSPEFPEMYLVSTAFGKHRSFVGRLMKNVREARGLNYGTYSYVEEFPRGGRLLSPPMQVARSRQAFTVWGRPTLVENGCFLLRQLHRELTQLTSEKGGLSSDEFETGKRHLVGSIPLLATGLERQLGYTIDAEFYGLPGNGLNRLQSKVRRATRKQTNAVVRKHVHPDQMNVVVVTRDANAFRDQILSESCGVHYQPGIEKPKQILAEDTEIAKHKLPLTSEQIEVVNGEAFFE